MNFDSRFQIEENWGMHPDNMRIRTDFTFRDGTVIDVYIVKDTRTGKLFVRDWCGVRDHHAWRDKQDELAIDNILQMGCRFGVRCLHSELFIEIGDDPAQSVLLLINEMIAADAILDRM